MMNVGVEFEWPERTRVTIVEPSPPTHAEQTVGLRPQLVFPIALKAVAN
jgi:hypothetical protein